MAYKHWQSGSAGLWSLREVKQMRQLLQLPQLTAWRVFPCCSVRRGNANRASEFWVLRRQRTECGEAKAVKSSGGKYQRRESFTGENSRGLQRGPLMSLAEYWLAHIWGGNYTKPRKESLKNKVGRTIPRNSQKDRIRVEGPCNTMAHWLEPS